MQYDRERKSGGYLERVLVDGAKPFLFRSRVRTLLGSPEWDGDNRIFSSPSLPAGFKYGAELPQDRAFMGVHHPHTGTPEEAAFIGPTSRHEVSEETDLNIFASGKTFPCEPQEVMRSRKPAGKDEGGVPEADMLVRGAGLSNHQKSEHHENQSVTELTVGYEWLDATPDMTPGTNMPIHDQGGQLSDAAIPITQKPVMSPEIGKGQPGRIAPPGSRKVFSGNPAKESGKKDLDGSIKDGSDAVSDAAMEMEATTIEIPGSSMASHNVFSSRLVEGVAQVKAETGSAESASRLPLQSDFASRSHGRNADQEGKGEMLWNDTEFQIHDGCTVEGDSLPIRHEGPHDQRMEQIPFGHSSVKGPDESGFETRGITASGAPRNREQFFSGPVLLPPERTVLHYGVDGNEDGGFRGIGSADASALERIEQIRRALREQATRISAEPNGRDDEPVGEQPAMETPLPPPPPVTAARVPIPRARVPKAFWQRRYLGHFHMRPLR
jgi:hypothetical protein